jgi:4-carboxymuconolactone decarboxylase
MTDRPPLKPLSIEDWDKSIFHVRDDMRGRPLNVHGLMAHNPALLAAWWNLRMHVVRGGGLSDRHRELIVLRVAVQMRAWYEWASHVERGLAAGLTTAEIERIRRGNEDGSWDPDDALVLRAVDDCIQQRGITGSTLRALYERFTPAQILDIIAVHGTYVFLGTIINTWDPGLDDFVKAPPGLMRENWLNDF